MPPIHASPKPVVVNKEPPRLDIDEEGTARAVFSKDWKPKHHKSMEDIHARDSAVAGDRTAQAATPGGNNHNLQLDPGAAALDAVYLRVGRHEGSNLRPGAVEPAPPAGVEEGEN